MFVNLPFTMQRIPILVGVTTDSALLWQWLVFGQSFLESRDNIEFSRNEVNPFFRAVFVGAGATEESTWSQQVV